MKKYTHTIKTIDTIGGMIIICTLIAAIMFANYSTHYQTIINFQLGSLPLKSWVKDVLMVFFFALIAMELKKEFYEGFLKNRKQIVLPLIAALGGMIIPAIIYILINIHHPEYYSGFAIPVATDIAFAICIFNFFAHSIPASIRIFLLSIAIFDDLGAIIIITFFYNHELYVPALLVSSFGIVGLFLLSYFKVTLHSFYLLIGIFLWTCFYKGGIHTTLSGVIMGLALPLYGQNQKPYLEKIMHQMHPLVQLFVLPLFAFTSSGISFNSINITDLWNPIFLGVFCGLFFGKQIGIFLFSYSTIQLGFAELPTNSKYHHIYFISILSGIGFTMSLFIANLAFTDFKIQNLIQLSVITASLLAVFYAIFYLELKK